MVRLPSLRGVIDRRILVNFRIEADALDAALPDPFEPRTVDGYAIGGICLLRLTDVRPRGFPALVGHRSENAAHRMGVEWDEDGERQVGVFVPRRDTSSRLTAAVGNRTMGRYHRADFDVDEGEGHYAVAMASRDGETRMAVSAREADGVPDSSVFDSLADASAYHRRGAVGYSPAADGDGFDGVKLTTDSWSVTPLSVEEVSASYFDHEMRFPTGSVAFDSALLMRNVGHETRDVGRLCPATESPTDGSGGAANSSTDEVPVSP
ncbi:DUF2071 domain-containing protein [Halosimplex amylolyticum]|uniref:DUF2071 domain-containing protein n=1 Tax=Halosimplex amylolyticum TaxID=3396616 RepID=UPI003F563FCC